MDDNIPVLQAPQPSQVQQPQSALSTPTLQPTVPPTTIQLRPQFPLETRKLKKGDDEREFNFLVIDKPEKWEPATSFTASFHLQMVGTGTEMEIPLRGISYSEWERMEESFELPKRPQPEDYDTEAILRQAQDDYERLGQQVLSRRRVYLLELATGQTIPGEKLEDKCNWLTEIGVGETQAIWNFISDRISATEHGDLKLLYDSMLSQAANINIVKFSDFNDLMQTSKIGSRFVFHRPTENFLVEIPLKQISEKVKQQIDAECKEPLPPGRPGNNPRTGKVEPDFVRNYNDPNYIRTLKAIARKRTVLRLDAALPFTIPGDGMEAKYKWLGDRLIGDIYHISEFIEQDLFTYRSRLNFF